jgi:hypothetical protein
MTERGDQWITVEDAADILRLTTRQTNRYGTGPDARLHIKRVGRRVLYSRQDVEVLAEELNVTLRPAVPKPPKSELVPIGEVFETMNAMQLRLEQAALDVGRLQGLLEAQRQQIADSEAVRKKLQDVEAERDRLLQAHQRLAEAEAERDRLQQLVAQMEDERAPPQQQSLWNRLRGK